MEIKGLTKVFALGLVLIKDSSVYHQQMAVAVYLVAIRLVDIRVPIEVLYTGTGYSVFLTNSSETCNLITITKPTNETESKTRPRQTSMD